MQRALFFKAVLVTLVALLLLVPLGMIHSLVGERAGRRAEAVRSVADSLAGPQTLVTPFIVLPYTDTWTEQLPVDRAGAREVRTVQRVRSGLVPWLAERAETRATVEVRDDHYRGLHRVRTYVARPVTSARFTAESRGVPPPLRPGAIRSWGTPTLAVPVSDVRGLREATLKAAGATLRALPATGLSTLPVGVHADLPPAVREAAEWTVEVTLELVGLERLAFVPAAHDSRIALQSAWPHPSFGGRHLPADRSVTDQGFTAEWRIADLASAASQQVAAAVRAAGAGPAGREGAADAPGEAAVAATAAAAVAAASGGRLAGDAMPARLTEALETTFVEPVNVYLLAERATKYGSLFIVLSFAALVITEVLRGAPVHPVQYLFVGLTLAIFFLLLLSLSEHLPFAVAYAIAAGGCVLLATGYLAAVLHGWRRGLAFGAALAASYGAVYVVLIAETHALLMGALLLFGVLATLMAMTRRIDWYRIGAPLQPTPARGA